MTIRKNKKSLRGKNAKQRRLLMSAIDSDNLSRYHQLNALKLTVKKFLPFSIVECPEFRTSTSMLVADDSVNISDMHSRTVKKLILEMYLATAARTRTAMQEAVLAVPIPIFI